MNSFTNTVLSLMLGWLRMLINNIWNALGSDGGGMFYQFLSAHWKSLVLILCVGGFLIDRIIYLIRWRPYYVWSSKLHRLRRGRAYDDEYDEADGTNDVPVADSLKEPEPESFAYSQPPESPAPSYQPAPPAGAYQRPSPTAYSMPGAYTPPASAAFSAPTVPHGYAQAAPASFSQATAHYAPIAQGRPSDHVPYQQPYTPPADLEPVFDDEPDSWEQGEALVQPLSDAYVNPARGMTSSFGMSKPEPVDYIRDMQAGFAPPISPEELYKPKPAAPPPPPAPESKESVHPGLNNEAFRQSFGLSPAGALSAQEEDDDFFRLENDDSSVVASVNHVPTFMPYSQDEGVHRGSGLRPVRRNPFAGIAKKARDLVGGDDEEHRATIHDLQPTVDMRSAFHEPVYPKAKDSKDGEY